MAENEVHEESTERSTSVTILVDSETSVAPDEDVAERSRSSSTVCSNRASITSIQRNREQFRSLKRRSSVENFGQFGFLVPALALYPQADGVSCEIFTSGLIIISHLTSKQIILLCKLQETYI